MPFHSKLAGLGAVSTLQALSVWSELEQAYYDNNGYGTDTAEIYAYTLLPNMPSERLHSASDLLDYYLDEYLNAGQVLVSLCMLFAEQRQCAVLIDDVPCAEWAAKDFAFQWRVHVKVVRQEKG